MFKSFLVAGLMLMAFGPLSSRGYAEVNVSITVPLPGLIISSPPGLFVIPGTYVYYPPDFDVDIFFYRGYWYRPYQGEWYIGDGYNGPWRSIGSRKVPRALIDIPRTYRRLPHRHERMPYKTVRKNWSTWEKERHWDNQRYDNDDRGKHRESGKERGGRGHGRGKHD
jgi:hypothetical protein